MVPFGMVFVLRVGWLAQQVRHRHAEPLRQLGQRGQPRVVPTGFEAREVALAQAGPFRQRGLNHAPRFSQLLDRVASFAEPFRIALPPRKLTCGRDCTRASPNHRGANGTPGATERDLARALRWSNNLIMTSMPPRPAVWPARSRSIASSSPRAKRSSAVRAHCGACANLARHASSQARSSGSRWSNRTPTAGLRGTLRTAEGLVRPPSTDSPPRGRIRRRRPRTAPGRGSTLALPPLGPRGGGHGQGLRFTPRHGGVDRAGVDQVLHRLPTPPGAAHNRVHDGPASREALPVPGVEDGGLPRQPHERLGLLSGHRQGLLDGVFAIAERPEPQAMPRVFAQVQKPAPQLAVPGERGAHEVSVRGAQRPDGSLKRRATPGCSRRAGWAKRARAC